MNVQEVTEGVMFQSVVFDPIYICISAFARSLFGGKALINNESLSLQIYV